MTIHHDGIPPIPALNQGYLPVTVALPKLIKRIFSFGLGLWLLT